MKNLFQLLKPEAKKNLVRNKIQYEASVNSIIKNLKRNYNVSNLTIHQVSNLYAFCEASYPESPVSAMYCETLFFQNDEELTFQDNEK